MLHVGIVEHAAALAHRFHQTVRLGGHHFRPFIRHETGNRHFYKSELPALRYDDNAALHFGKSVGGLSHIVLRRADDDHMMAVMGDGRGNRAGPTVSKAPYE